MPTTCATAPTTSSTTTATDRRDSSVPRGAAPADELSTKSRRSGCWPKNEPDDGDRYSQLESLSSRPRTPPSSSGREDDEASSLGPGGGGPEQRASSSPRGSVAWVAALMNHRFVRSFSERLVGGKRARAECWWRKLRAQRLTGA